MTETIEQQAAAPQLIHSGTYALWRTPTGGYHVVYQREQAADENGTILPVGDAPPQHLRELSEQAATMVARLLDRDTPIPPMMQAVLDGKMPSVKDLLKMRAEAAAHMNGDDDG